MSLRDRLKRRPMRPHKDEHVAMTDEQRKAWLETVLSNYYAQLALQADALGRGQVSPLLKGGE